MNLSGTWKSVDGIKVKTDYGVYEITQIEEKDDTNQIETHIFITGENKHQKWKNIGYGKVPGKIENNSTIHITWTDTQSSSSSKNIKIHETEIEIMDDNHIKTTSNQGSTFSFGNWERIDIEDFEQLKSILECI